MDYTATPLGFRIRKLARYLKLYGVRRTLVKVRGQYHARKKYERLPEPRAARSKGTHVGIIGCGNFAYSCIAFYLARNYGRVIRGAMDTDIHKAASLFETYGLDYYTDDAEMILSDPAVDLVYIASNHATHAEYAIRALERGKSVHIEKPHAVTEDQLARLCDAMSQSGGKVNLGFNRPDGRIGRAIRQALASEVGAGMYNWFVAGHELSADHWYFRPEEGGRVLGNLCHWTDFTYQLVDPAVRYPITIRPTRWEKADCDIAVTYVFGDGSIGVITFSAKGHTFEGVKERFSAHRGNVLITMDDFKSVVIEVVDRKRRRSLPFRDHGHEENIRSSYELVRPAGAPAAGKDASYVWGTGELFLRTREALETNRVITLHQGRKKAATDERAR